MKPVASLRIEDQRCTESFCLPNVTLRERQVLHRFYVLFLAAVLTLSQTGCIVTPCTRTLNHYTVDSIDMDHIEQMIIGQDGSVAFAGTYVRYRWDGDYMQAQAMKTKHILEEHPAYVIGSPRNLQYLVQASLFPLQQTLAGQGTPVGRLPGLDFSADSYATVDKRGGSSTTISYDRWKLIIDHNDRHPPDPLLLPHELCYGTIYQANSTPIPYCLDGRQIKIEFHPISGQIQRRHVRPLYSIIYPFSVSADLAVSTVLTAWTVAVVGPAEMLLERPFHIRTTEFLWPMPFYNMCRKLRGLRPLRVKDVAPS